MIKESALRNLRSFIATAFALLRGVSGWSATIPADARVSRLAKEVHAKGWIVYSARTERGDWDLFLMRPDGSGRHNISNTPAFSELGGRFSPDKNCCTVGFRVIPRSITM